MEMPRTLTLLAPLCLEWEIQAGLQFVLHAHKFVREIPVNAARFLIQYFHALTEKGLHVSW
ncbi:MAG: hypothetical protein ACO1QB_02240 [Verrucomicrobiales bacterium]